MPVKLELHDFQKSAVDEIMVKVEAGNDFVVSSPTGSGKTEMLIGAIERLQEQNKRILFCADLTTIKTQTAARMRKYGVKCEYWLRDIPPSQSLRPIITTPQALARRRHMWEILNVHAVVVDEAHIVYGSAMDFCDAYEKILIGFTATPVTQKCISRFVDVVNVASTQELVSDKRLIFPKLKTGVAADMRTARTYGSQGDWRDEDKSNRQRRIVGQALDQWEEYGQEFFGYTPKTIMFMPKIDDCVNASNLLADRGYVFVVVSSDDGRSPEEREQLFEIFNTTEDIDGLLSVRAIAKGADFPSVECLSMQNPYRKSHSSVIQEMGRIMRTFPGKYKALCIDNAENLQRFNATLGEFFRIGVNKLGDFAEHVPKDFLPQEVDYCPQCGEILLGWNCIACGYEDLDKKKRLERKGGSPAEVGHADGELEDIELLTMPQMEEYIREKYTVKEFYRQILTYQKDRNKSIGRAYYVTLDVFSKKAPFKWSRSSERLDPDPIIVEYLREAGRRFWNSD